MLTADLVGYQNDAYAGRFLDAVADARRHEQTVAPGSSRLTEAVARNLHKLMAYKDEYEVARLLLLPEGEQAAKAVGGSEARVSWHLHPPMLKALGMDSKLEFGTWSKPAFAALRRGKRLRGTRLDPFGRTDMRRAEAALPAEYLATMAGVYADLTADRLDRAIDVAAPPGHDPRLRGPQAPADRRVPRGHRRRPRRRRERLTSVGQRVCNNASVRSMICPAIAGS